VNAPTAVVVGVGAEHGLGAALCRRFAIQGYHVLVAGRTPEKITQVARTICEADGSAESIPVDTTRENDVARLFDRAMSPGNGREPADFVVFNAGNNQRIEFRDLSAEQFEQFWRVGCFGGFLVVARRRGDWLLSVEAQSSSLALPPACEASQALRTSPPRKPACA
jgi:NAD(P)-dependent dehydrogenase (short-subunit alcohol dehydrogenase family)